jgi:predicted helicase
MSTTFNDIIDKYRKYAFSERDKGTRFERLMKGYLKTDAFYENLFSEVWLWEEFPGKKDLGGHDTGIDLVAKTKTGDYWAIQCKCQQENSVIDKGAVDSFLATSSREFKDDELRTTRFAHRLWISTTNKWGANAQEAIQNQNPPVGRLSLNDLREAAIDWHALENGIHGEGAKAPKKDVYPHVFEARDKVHEYFKTHERGKLVMACGTGKTMTSLKIAEKETGGKGMVLFMVPSIALIGQTLREWTSQAEVKINAVAICSDPQITQKLVKNDFGGDRVVDLAMPASTNAQEILRQFRHNKKSGVDGMTVVFSTYQSIEVIAEAQKTLLADGFPEFDLIICDEAHRTTGTKLADEDESSFTKVHDGGFIKAKRRLYMTATPKMFDKNTKSRAAEKDVELWSMDNVEYFGEEIFHIGFGEAVSKGMLTDYKVMILTLSDKDVPPSLQKMVADKDSHEIQADDVTKLIGCINAMSKQLLGDMGILEKHDPEPMRRAVAFCPSIDASKQITKTFNASATVYLEAMPEEKKGKMVTVEAKHVDGSMSAPMRDELLGWLKEDGPEMECRVLNNVRCLSEGVDVPSLDAVLFLSARNSQVDVVQSVGRVMRKAPGKKYGYIIIPIIVASDVDADLALDKNDRYKVVWTVLNALRAHDDRFNAMVNKIELNKRKPETTMVVGTAVTFEKGEAVTKTDDGKGIEATNKVAEQIRIQFEEMQNAVFARMVDKVGSRGYWENWAKEVAVIAERQIERIDYLIKDRAEQREAFNNFLVALQQNLNPGIQEKQAIEMLAQHIVTRPIFDALFEGYSFVKTNVVSTAIQTMLDGLEGEMTAEDSEKLQKFYEFVRINVADLDNAKAKQEIIKRLYENFFEVAFKTMTQQLGIVYTPVDVVDFIVHSVEALLKKEFGRSMADEGVHILDPFTGTGTFMTRLIQSGLIDKENLKRKYKYELHANEIVLLAYYIAAVNIESIYHDAVGAEAFESFEGICLTDTFQLTEQKTQQISSGTVFGKNFERVAKQNRAPVRVIIGNPPYSAGQKNANDNAQNQKYDGLDRRIAETYAKETNATNKNSLYDSYIRAYRWSTDRLGPDGGIVAFVSNGAWIDGNAQDGLRKCFEKEYSSIYVFNLRGNQRTQGELSRREGGKIFGAGSRTPIAITFLVKKKGHSGKAKIHYRDIGDYLSREDKLKLISKYRSIDNKAMEWQILEPNASGDWINERSEGFESLIPIGDKDDKKGKSFFGGHYSNGVKTQRDTWVYNSNKVLLAERMKASVDFYNEKRDLLREAKSKNSKINSKDVLDLKNKTVSWTRALVWDAEKNKAFAYDPSRIVISSYRPFFKQHLFYSREWNEMIYLTPKLFPSPEYKNKVICVSGSNVLITDFLPDLHFNGDTQAFPLYWFEEVKKKSGTLFDGAIEGNETVRRDGVTDWILKECRTRYGKNVGKEDIFFYVYGVLHSKGYREKFANDLRKMLPRLPLVEDVRDFWAFKKAGEKLANLHLNYEKVQPNEAVVVTGAEKLGFLDEEAADTKLYLVQKMRFAGKDNKSIIYYNDRIQLSNIPIEAYEYVVNGKSAIEWVMEKYQVKKTDEKSGIKNDPNDWSTEVGNPRYILDLLLSVIEMSVRSVEIIHDLPEITFE